MYIKDLTTEEFQELIRRTVIETLQSYLIDPEDQLQVLPHVREQLLKIRGDRQQKDDTISSEEAYQLLDLD